MATRNNHSLHGQHIDVSYAGEDLSERVLSGTYVGVDFRNTNLRGACLIGTFISSSFCGADLSGADLSAGKFVNTDFTDARGTNGRVR